MDKSLLLTPGLGEAEVPIPRIGGSVRVRGMSRQELLDSGRILEADGPLAAERYVLACCLLDPVLTQDEVGQWQASSPAMELNGVMDKVNELSGIGPGVEKAAYKSDGAEPDA